MSFHAGLQLTLDVSLEEKDGWVKENRNGEKSYYRKPKEGNHLKMAETERGRTDPSQSWLKIASQLFKSTHTQTLLLLDDILYKKKSLF